MIVRISAKTVRFVGRPLVVVCDKNGTVDENQLHIVKNYAIFGSKGFWLNQM